MLLPFEWKFVDGVVEDKANEDCETRAQTTVEEEMKIWYVD